MSRHVALLVLAVLIAVAAAVSVWPARWLMRAVPAHAPLAVVAAEGTLWSGNATLALGRGELQRTLPDPLRWRWSFSRGPQMIVEHPWLAGPLIIAPSLTGIGISAQTLQLPAQALATLDARIAAVDPDGRLIVSWPASFVGNHARPAGAQLLKAEWRDAGSALTPVRPLGHYTLDIRQSQGDALAITLATQKGPLLMNGNGVLDPGGRFSFDGIARADPTAGASVHAALADVLGALGPRHNDQTQLQFR